MLERIAKAPQALIVVENHQPQGPQPLRREITQEHHCVAKAAKMKTLLILVVFAVTAMAQTRPIGPPVDNRLIEATRAKDAQARERAKLSQQWRVVDGKSGHMAEPGWRYIKGRVLQAHNDGLRIRISGNETVFLVHYPGVVADDESVAAYGKEVGLHRYNTVAGSAVTLRKYDFGTPYAAPPPSPAEVARAKALAEQAAFQRAQEQQDMRPRVLKFQLEQAEKGLPSFQYLVGQRYLEGSGVTQSVAQAREWFTKAAAQGDSQAKKALDELPVLK